MLVQLGSSKERDKEERERGAEATPAALIVRCPVARLICAARQLIWAKAETGNGSSPVQKSSKSFLPSFMCVCFITVIWFILSEHWKLECKIKEKINGKF